MEIKRNFEEIVFTKRRFVIHQTPPVKQTTCTECGAPVLAIEPAANWLGITQRRIFRIIETGAAHFIESESGALMICMNSLAAVLDGETLSKQT